MVRMVLVCVSPGGGSRSCAVVGMVLVCTVYPQGEGVSAMVRIVLVTGVYPQGVGGGAVLAMVLLWVCDVLRMVLVCIPRGRECCGGDGVGVYPQR